MWLFLLRIDACSSICIYSLYNADLFSLLPKTCCLQDVPAEEYISLLNEVNGLTLIAEIQFCIILMFAGGTSSMLICLLIGVIHRMQ